MAAKTPSGKVIEALERQRRQIQLTKRGHQFRVAYETGDEPLVLEQLAEMASRPDLAFDWFDAAVLSHQVGAHLAKELRTLLPKNAA